MTRMILQFLLTLFLGLPVIILITAYPDEFLLLLKFGVLIRIGRLSEKIIRTGIPARKTETEEEKVREK